MIVNSQHKLVFNKKLLLFIRDYYYIYILIMIKKIGIYISE